MERDFWRDIIKNNYQLPKGHSVLDLTVELLQYLPSDDLELRDIFAYGILARWIIIYGYHSVEDLRAMISWLTPIMLEWLGEQDTDSVFGRSYAALILSLIVYRDQKLNFLEEAEARNLLDKARHYLVAERDLRAYVPDKGWANACGNTCDLLRFLAWNRHMNNADLRRLLDSIGDKLLAENNVFFVHEEDDRLAQVVSTILRRNLIKPSELVEWLARFTDWRNGEFKNTEGYNPFLHAVHHNTRNFLRALYCQLRLLPMLSDEVKDFEDELLMTLKGYGLYPNIVR